MTPGNGHGGDGGDGGTGGDCGGGDGGDGGNGTASAGNGGDGGNSGINSTGCGGDGGDGGDITPNPNPGNAGDGGDGGNGPCPGEGGAGGTRPKWEALGQDGAPGKAVRRIRGIPYPAVGADDEAIADYALTGTMDTQLLTRYWDNNLQAPSYDWNFIEAGVDAQGIVEVQGVVHPDSLNSERIRAIIEFKVDGPNPLIEFQWRTGVLFDLAQSKPIQGEPDWRRMNIAAPRLNGQPFGPGADMFIYRNRDVEVRVFDIQDFGPLGDANLDGLVDINDLSVITQNLGNTNATEVTDGDLNADSKVDLYDTLPVLQSIQE
ncbi:MAG: hypothetical protein CMJ35_05755 [Phycisphaerae bacterium]|nr:hypothetical protein [Phycisphaerae bacterium]